MVELMRHPTGFGIKDIVAGGNTGMVYHDEGSRTVIKTPHDDMNLDAILVEIRIYERLQQYGGHKGLLTYYGIYESGISLEYAPNFALHLWLHRNKDVSLDQKISWVGQITDALHFVYSINVVHGDVTSRNILLTKELDAKLTDFGGSSLDGSRLLTGVKTTHQ